MTATNICSDFGGYSVWSLLKTDNPQTMCVCSVCVACVCGVHSLNVLTHYQYLLVCFGILCKENQIRVCEIIKGLGGGGTSRSTEGIYPFSVPLKHGGSYGIS